MTLVQQLINTFESYKHSDENDLEFWFAREVQ